MSNLIPWRGPTAPPPQMRPIDPTTLTLMREHALNVYALAELTGVPTLYRWLRAIWERRPIHEVEREYFEPLYRRLQQLAAPGLLRLETQQLRGVVPIDYIAEGKRAPPVQPPQIGTPEYVRKMLQEVGAPTSPEDVAAQVSGRSAVLAAAVLPLGLAGMTREAAKQLAKIAAAGFGVGGTGAAVARAAQGFPEEAPKAFIEVGLASTVVADIANALKALAASVPAPQLRAAARQVLLRRQAGSGSPWRDPEGETFIDQINEALLALKRGDTSKYDQLLRQFEDWQKKIEEFRRLYEARQRGQLTPEDETRYTKLLKEVSEIRDKYDLLKQYIEAARETGLETLGRQLEFDKRMIEDLARAAQETPPGPPPKDLLQWLQRVDLDFLQKLVKDRSLLARYARRFGVDEQTMAERVSLFLRERWVERLPQDDIKKMLMDESLLKKHADELGVSADKLREKLEELLQRRMGLRPPPEPQPIPERPPIEPIRRPETQPKPPETQFRPPETEVQGGKGQVLIVRAEEEVRPAVRRLEELPDVQTRLRTLLRSRLREESPEVGRMRGAEGEAAARRRATSDEQTPGTRVREESPAKTREEQPVKTRVKEEQLTKTQTSDETAVKTDRVVLDNETLRAIIPALPAYVFSMPATTVLAMISRAVGAPIVLAPGIPRPLPRESFANWLDRVFGSGFSWRSLAMQRETFVFA